MFIILKKYVLYFSIPSFIYATSLGDIEPHECTTTISFKQRVEQEMGVFDEFANEISDIGKRGEFRGSLRQIIRRAIQADEFLKERGALETEKKNEERYREVIVVRSRLEYLESVLYPKYRLKSTSRKSRWQVILSKSNSNPYAQEFRARVLNAYCFKSSKVENGEKVRIRSDQNGINVFSSAMQSIYADLSSNDYAPHKLVDHKVLEKLRSDVNEVSLLLKTLSVQQDPVNVIALKLISEDLELPEDIQVGSATELEAPLNRVEILPVHAPFQNIDEANVRELFPGNKGVENATISIKPEVILVDFEDTQDAMLAENNHLEILVSAKGRKFFPVMVNLTFKSANT